MRLTFENHDRDLAGLKYVYPVISRRAQGVSIGINLNPNNACNFRCVYCQVPDLVYGKAPVIDLKGLHAELDSFLEWVQNGDFMERVVPEGSRRLNDLAFSGNGEPTSAANFDEIVAMVGELMQTHKLAQETKLVLISNGSLARQEQVQRGLKLFPALKGELWFKLDSATVEGRARINSYQAESEQVKENFKAASVLCPTWLQTCAFARDGEPPSEAEQGAYMEFLRWIRSEGLPLEGVLLYGLARQSHQPEAAQLSKVSDEWLEAYAERMRAEDVVVKVSP
ncbi:MAG: wyosine [tRNA(Phe)-imidazoG37] synthetase (radical SAM superfamily) [Planctomycetota bacterium]|jgi:wyosine [tRNA(Phe)-imidazoG37] synthetase (radical SAM superfamily)